MRFLLAMIGALVASSTFAETDALAEGCSALKNKQRRAACFDQLQRMIKAEAVSDAAAAKAPAPPPSASGTKRMNGRAYLCEAYEFAEINSMDFAELESVYCSALAGGTSTMDKALGTPESDPSRDMARLKASLAASEKCKRLWMPAYDVAARKFPGQKLSCADYPKPPATGGS